MSDQDIVDTIAGLIADESVECHRYVNGCQLEYAPPCAEKILAALRERYAIVALPEPHSVTDNTAGWPGDGWAVSRNVGKVLADRPRALDPDEARAFAAALLAAADAAERDQ